MGNVALLLRSMGHAVMGCDQAIYPPMSDLLRDADIEVMEGYNAERLQKLNPDLVVVGNAYSRGNCEVEYLLESRSLPYVSLPEILRKLLLHERNNIVVAGTHGKTSTTSIAAYLLEQAGENPGYLIGGVPLDPESGWSVGESGGPFVIEGDEYDSSFFDKRSKFIHYQPHIVILNNLEFDHADIFRDLQDVKRSFSHLIRLVPSNGYLLVNADDENTLSLADIDWTNVLQVGVAKQANLRIQNYATTSGGSRFDLVWKDQLWQHVEWGMTGLFNARNAAMASLAAALISTGHDSLGSFSLEVLSRFRGVKRRQQQRYSSEKLIVLEDFGHHATAIRDSLVAFGDRYPERQIIAAFEPRTNTSRLEAMRGPTIEALKEAHIALIGAVKSSSQSDIEIMDTKSLAEDLRNAGSDAEAFESNDDLYQKLGAICNDSNKPLLVMFFTNGSFGGIIERFVKDCEARSIRA